MNHFATEYSFYSKSQRNNDWYKQLIFVYIDHVTGSTVKINESHVLFKIDTDSHWNIILIKAFDQIKGKPQIIPSDNVLKPNGGGNIKQPEK